MRKAWPIVLWPIASISTRHQVTLNTGDQTLLDVTSLKDKIYVRFHKSLSVYEDVHPFACVKDVDVPSVSFTCNFTKACEKNLCLYTTSDLGVCKLSAIDYNVKIWLPDVRQTKPCPLSVCRDGRLLLLRNDISLPCIELYREDAQLVQSVPLPTTLYSWTSLKFYCAIESDEGEFFVSCHGDEEFRSEYKLALVARIGSSSLVISPQPKGAWSQPHFDYPPCVTSFTGNLFIVYDSNNGKVVTLDQEFNVKHVLLTRDKEQIHRPRKIHYKETRNQLIIIDSYNGKSAVDVFSLVDDTEGEQTNSLSAEHATTLDIRNLIPTDVTSLRNDILILLDGRLIAAYEDKNQFNHKYDVLLRESISPEMSTSFLQIIANNNRDDIYVATSTCNSAFRFVRSAANFVRIGDSLDINTPYNLSRSSDGDLLMPATYPPSFDIRKPDGILSVNLPSYMDEIPQVVEISCELFVVVYKTREQRNSGNILKLKADGEFELRPKPDDKSDQPGAVWSLARYSSDRVIATDNEGNRVILLDSDLNTQYTLLKCRNPLFMCYKKDKRQLIVCHTQSSEVDVLAFDDE